MSCKYIYIYLYIFLWLCPPKSSLEGRNHGATAIRREFLESDVKMQHGYMFLICVAIRNAFQINSLVHWLRITQQRQRQQRKQRQQHLAWISAVLVIDQWEDERICRKESARLTGWDSDINLPGLCGPYCNVPLSAWRTESLKLSSSETEGPGCCNTLGPFSRQAAVALNLK